MKKNIDILLSVVDNYGDMGFACELILGLERAYPWIFHYTLWTDERVQTSIFFEKNSHVLPLYRIEPIEQFGMNQLSSFCLSLFHGFLPKKKFFALHSYVLRIDYISFDAEWLNSNESEHIHSTSERQVIEIIPSPFSTWWGIFPCDIAQYTRSEIARLYHLDEDKEWISIFCYTKTLIERIDLREIPENREVLILGSTWERNTGGTLRNIHFLPFVDIERFHHILGFSLWSIIRGEISLMNMVSLGRPFLWDMYKMMGGLHREQSEDFLEYKGASPEYQRIHMRLNGQIPWSITLNECESVLINSRDQHESIRYIGKNLINEVKKYIDSFYFSL